MIELTASQIAAGWVAIPDDCVEMPAELAGVKEDEWRLLFAAGIGSTEEGVLSIFNAERVVWRHGPRSSMRIVAYRILKPATQQVPAPAARQRTEQDAFEDWVVRARPSGDADAVQRTWIESGGYEDWCADEEERVNPNREMLARDGTPQTFEQRVKQLVGTGMIFSTPRVERCNLLVVAPISTNGFSLWGA